VSDARYLDTIAAALGDLGATTALVVSSEDGLDEISVSAPTRAVELKDGGIRSYSITPESLGVETSPPEAVGAADPDRSAEIARAVMSGARGPERELTVANAGAAIYVGGRAETLADGVRAAGEAIDSGAARDSMERFVERTQALAVA
jgi:anthranilate phosphoribosyltransferase